MSDTVAYVEQGQGLDNTDLFYNQQIRSRGKSWELSNSNIKIVGLLQDFNYSFTIDNKFEELSNKAVGKQAVDSWREGLSKIQENIPFLGKSKEIGQALKKDIDAASPNNGKVTFFSDIVDKFSNAASNFGSDMLHGLDKGISGLLPNTMKTLGLENSISELSSRGVSDKAMIMSQIVSPFDDTKIYKGTTAAVPSNGITLTAYCFHKLGKGTNVIDFILKCIEEISGKTATDEGGMFGLQAPPNNYIPTLGNLRKMSNSPTDGTWNLRLGNLKYYNVLIDKFNFTLEKYNSIESWATENGIENEDAVITRDPFMATLTFEFGFANKVIPEDIRDLLIKYKSS